VCYERICPGHRQFASFCSMILFYGGDLLAPPSNPQGGEPPIFDFLQLLSSTLSATVPIWRPFPPSPTWGSATHLTWCRVFRLWDHIPLSGTVLYILTLLQPCMKLIIYWRFIQTVVSDPLDNNML
jgi:hypothetical protein